MLVGGGGVADTGVGVLVGSGVSVGTGGGVLVGDGGFVGTRASVLVGSGVSVGITGVGVGLAAHPLAARMTKPRSASRKHALPSVLCISISSQPDLPSLAIRLGL